MSIIDSFGGLIAKKSDTSPEKAAKILKLGWQAQNLKNRFAPDKSLAPSGRYLTKLMMDAMLYPLKHPESSTIVSVFAPCEMLHIFGLHPYNVEGFSCYIAASHAEAGFLRATEAAGLAETLCSYHRVFIGAAKKGVMPKPKCIVSTNLVCDANQLTFRYLARHYDVPHFIVDVPFSSDEGAVAYVERQIRELGAFLSKVTGKPLDEDALKETMRRSLRTQENYLKYQALRADKTFLQDLVTPLYEFGTTNILMGTHQAEKYAEMAAADAEKMPPAQGLRLYWVHTVPYWMDTVKDLLKFKNEAQIVGIDLATSSFTDFDPDKPYEALARKMVYNQVNGPASRRIGSSIENAKALNADGAVWFCHWGCKHTMGAAMTAKKKFEAAGIPLLILDGDGCDRTKGGSEQTSTRIGAFLEMLKGAGHER